LDIINIISIICILVCIILLCKNDRKAFLKVVFCVYIALVASVTLVVFRGSPYAQFELDPIASYRRWLTAPPDLARIEALSIILNIAMFVPLGFLVPALWRGLAKIYIILPLSILATLVIEATQLITNRGVFSIEDIIHNTAGGLFGYAIFKIFYRRVSKIKTHPS